MEAKERKLTVLETLVCGGISGAIAKTIIAPLDRQKIIFQVTQKGFSFPTAFKALRITYETRGFKALFKGNGAMMIRIVPYAAIQYSTFEKCKRLSAEYYSPVFTPFIRFVCGATAGAVSVSLTYPLDLMRARLAFNNYKDSNLISVFRSTISLEGPLALFQGLKPTIIGQVFYSGISFSIFETCKEIISEGNLKDLSVYQRFFCGALAGVIAQTSTYPLDVIRRRMQIDPANSPRYTGIKDAFTKIYRNEGLKRGLYKGLSMNWLKGPIAVGTSFTVYDYISSLIRKRDSIL